MGMLMSALMEARKAPRKLHEIINEIEANEVAVRNARMGWSVFVAERAKLEKELSRAQAAANAAIYRWNLNGGARVILGVN